MQLYTNNKERCIKYKCYLQPTLQKNLCLKSVYVTIFYVPILNTIATFQNKLTVNQAPDKLNS